MKIVDKISKVIWLLTGILVIVTMVFAINICVDVKNATSDIRGISSEVTINDMRHILDVVEKQLDKDILSLELQQQRLDRPLEWTTDNWQDYLDFCGKYGYVISDYTWQEYRYGRLVP